MLNCAKVSSRQKKLVLHDIWSFLYTLADGLRGQYFEVVFASKYICATLQYKYTLLEYFCIGCVFSVVSIHYPPSIFVQWHKRKITKGPFSKEALFIPDGSAVQLRIIIPQRLHQYMCIMRSFCFPFVVVTQISFFWIIQLQQFDFLMLSHHLSFPFLADIKEKVEHEFSVSNWGWGHGGWTPS